MAAGAAPGITVPKPDSPPASASPSKHSKKKDDDGNAVVDYLKSREGRSMINTVARGVFGMLKKRR
jgi:hypothetical protein